MYETIFSKTDGSALYIYQSSFFWKNYTYLPKLLPLTSEVMEILTNYSFLKYLEYKNKAETVYACVF